MLNKLNGNSLRICFSFAKNSTWLVAFTIAISSSYYNQRKIRKWFFAQKKNQKPIVIKKEV